ncbi:exoV-like protein [Clostridia bacterium]|nr:exoV-like protein [Clostridia bacterium]
MALTSSPYMEALPPQAFLQKTINLYFYRYQNAGDLFGPWMMYEMFNVRALWKQQGEAEMVAVGSILDHFATARQHPRISDEPIKVWGSGYLHAEPFVIPLCRELNVLALRGPLTKERVEATIGSTIDCPLADPGLLASRLPGLPYVHKDIELGIIPHYQEKCGDFFYHAKSRIPKAEVLDVQMDPRRFIAQLRRCKTILTTSLHGAIFADSFGIPNRWCVLNSREPWWDYKFYDYYGSYGLDMKPLNLDDEPTPTPEAIKDSYQIDPAVVTQKQDALIMCYPYKYGSCEPDYPRNSYRN